MLQTHFVFSLLYTCNHIFIPAVFFLIKLVVARIDELMNYKDESAEVIRNELRKFKLGLLCINFNY